MATHLIPFFRGEAGPAQWFAPLDNFFERFAGPDYPGGVAAPLSGYDIERVGDDGYRIIAAVPGFAEEALSVETENGELVLRAACDSSQEDAKTYLHRGIVRGGFERRFRLGEDIKVTGARLDKGLLQVDLKREVPEERRPRRIKIAS